MNLSERKKTQVNIQNIMFSMDWFITEILFFSKSATITVKHLYQKLDVNVGHVKGNQLQQWIVERKKIK